MKGSVTMTKKFYKCNICGNQLGAISDAGIVPECCGQTMEEMIPNSADAAQEKHVPVIVRDGGKITVKVGSVPHPMGDDHLIQWVVLCQGNLTQRLTLDPGDAPEAAFCVRDAVAPVVVYGYCNLHGLWTAEG